jgi:hypothetical protein
MSSNINKAQEMLKKYGFSFTGWGTTSMKNGKYEAIICEIVEQEYLSIAIFENGRLVVRVEGKTQDPWEKFCAEGGNSINQ